MLDVPFLDPSQPGSGREALTRSDHRIALPAMLRHRSSLSCRAGNGKSDWTPNSQEKGDYDEAEKYYGILLRTKPKP
jgi:hypothetical protein